MTGDMAPSTGKGAFAFIFVGFTGALFALLIAQFIPSIIPASATGVKL